jgi:hypothetical protein
MQGGRARTRDVVGAAPGAARPRSWPERLERRRDDRRRSARRSNDTRSVDAERFERELQRERQLRARAESTAQLLARMVAEENSRRRDAEAHARITFAELSAASKVGWRPTRSRGRRARRRPTALLRRLLRID